MRKPFFARFLAVSLLLVLTFGLSVPAFAAEDLDHQYSFEHEFDFEDFYRISGVPWYGVQFGESFDYSAAAGDYVVFSVDSYKFEASFQVRTASGKEFHYIGNASSFSSLGEDTGEPYCLVICPDDPAWNQLLLRQDYFEKIYAGDDSKLHVAVSVAHYDFPPETFLERLFSIFSHVGEWLRSQLDFVISLFWNAAASELTFFGLLALISLGFSVVLLLIKVILNFLHFRS
jgi:hypothetical protein